MMKDKQYKHFGIIIDKTTYHKLKYIAEYEGRSIAGQFRYLTREYIHIFEKKFGSIDISKEK